jgi:hypothetical protein
MLPPTELHHTTHPPWHLMPQQTPCQAAPKTQPPPRHPLPHQRHAGRRRTCSPNQQTRPPTPPRRTSPCLATSHAHGGGEHLRSKPATQHLFARPRPAGHITPPFAHPPLQLSACDAHRGPYRARVGLPRHPATCRVLYSPKLSS